MLSLYFCKLKEITFSSRRIWNQFEPGSKLGENLNDDVIKGKSVIESRVASADR